MICNNQFSKSTDKTVKIQQLRDKKTINKVKYKQNDLE